MSWRRVTFSIPRTSQDDLIVCLHEMGTLGIEALGDDLAAWFPDGYDETRLVPEIERTLGCGSGVRIVRSEPVRDGFWHERWVESLEPFEIGDGFLVVPGPATPRDTRGRRVIRLTPGRAFGTGEHPTTRMCLALIEQDLRRGESLLDVGTGTGILAIVAKALGAETVVGVDTDETSVRAAALNVMLNGAGKVHLIAGSLEALHGPVFDLVVANISGAALLRLMPMLAALVGREAIVSGLLTDEAHDVIAAASLAGMDVVHRLVQGDWMALVLRRRDGA